MRFGKRDNRDEAQRLGSRLDQIVDPNHPLTKLAPATTRPSSSSGWMGFIVMALASPVAHPADGGLGHHAGPTHAGAGRWAVVALVRSRRA